MAGFQNQMNRWEHLEKAPAVSDWDPVPSATGTLASLLLGHQPGDTERHVSATFVHQTPVSADPEALRPARVRLCPRVTRAWWRVGRSGEKGSMFQKVSWGGDGGVSRRGLKGTFSSHPPS